MTFKGSDVLACHMCMKKRSRQCRLDFDVSYKRKVESGGSERCFRMFCSAKCVSKFFANLQQNACGHTALLRRMQESKHNECETVLLMDTSGVE